MCRVGSKCFVVGMLALLALVCVVGCGKKGGGEPTGEVDGYIYVPAARSATATLAIWPQAYEPPTRDTAEVLPVEGARVSLMGTDVEVVTTADGYFKISGLKAGKYTLIVKYGELAPAIQVFDVIGGHITHCDNRPPPENATTSSPSSIADTAAFRQLVLSQETQPEAGTVVAELAGGTDLQSARTSVTLPDEAVAVVSANEAHARGLLEQWNRTVLAARQELGTQPPVDRATAVARDSTGRSIIRVETAAQY